MDKKEEVYKISFRNMIAAVAVILFIWLYIPLFINTVKDFEDNEIIIE
jgi:uncharacterized membrane protein (DUF106 family)